MKVWVPSQLQYGEPRAALVPAVVKKLSGHPLVVESGLGRDAGHDDDAYRAAGATVSDSADAQWTEADVVVTLRPPTAEQAGRLKRGAILIGMLAPLKNGPLIRQLADAGVTAFSMEFVPRTSRAQAMDVLSSQANIAGYKAVLLAADLCPKLFPMLITAAGTIAPSKVMVIGAGVAGLQAIATAKRLGAVVEAYDVRPAVKEQIQSLGARFIELPLDTANAQTAGGYAREQSAEERQKQADLMAKHVVASDAVISTAAVFGKAPPMLIPAAVVQKMRRGAVIMDMAADVDAGRGNCELTRPGQRITTDNGVVIDGTLNLAAMIPVHASQAYANNMHSFMSEFLKKDTLELNMEDEIQKGAAITHDGKIVNETVAKALGDA